MCTVWTCGRVDVWRCGGVEEEAGRGLGRTRKIKGGGDVEKEGAGGADGTSTIFDNDAQWFHCECS